ncbi:Cytochrome c peroxidase [Bibersteinia trehalosi USDA-ARS-USMARC-188]|uniref:Cytochrome c peroxidase n=4 Tax=Bibersteinia trehalosi TaxID=47735 RepID=A0A4V7IC54_BIBTR|nr:cytochrome-c peroxidase [Bibersteinia trehalosi]AGH37594.1 Cytochrome c peroxidase [Bibersteinia trehalosi USDA-ARS-USMARC-192]AHG82596.1 Cytochrome c peroxidase [Bibersteinia trehalosi USDA-ARS-USMARC-188]AHG84931.1 Cytochrome c peroxidase [Bibersteinia trehalosi USDA-ARS-USMARC-189]OAQ13752.1 cytochrome C peroxidase [Bibersteinia trehalosi Y31]RRN06276.1 cytochrome-c peroxidase [Bibersteinia trehalosi]
MKKLLISALALGAAGFFGTVGYIYQFDKQQAEQWLNNTEVAEQHKNALGVMFKNGCQYCHTPSAEMPFYFNLPIANNIMRQDIAEGNRVFRLDRLIEGMQDPSKLSEADLAKLQRVIENREMPAAKFIHIHWGSRPDAEESKTLLDWVYAQREAKLSTFSNIDKTALVQPIPDSIPTDPKKVALGDKIYHDGRLSADGTIQCHTCHQLDKGGVDGLQFSTGIDGLKGGINAPTVYNAAFNFVQFWDGRAADLADQAKGPPLNPVEMGGKNWEQLLSNFRKDPAFMQEFLAVFPKFDEFSLTDAIAEFEKTLITPNSAFDKFLKGEQNALTEVQKRGYEHFKNAKCDTCHTGINMGGQSYEVFGLYADYFRDRATPITDDDRGRFNQTQDPADMHRFKVPTLRNVALTAPYMHDGTVTDLREAVRIMGKYQSNKNFTEQELDEITAFLESLTGEYKGSLLTREE